jgi:uncharacterized protein (TIGR02679 family)
MTMPYHEIPRIRFDLDEFVRTDQSLKRLEPREHARRVGILRAAFEILPVAIGREELGILAGARPHEFDLGHSVGEMVCRALARWQEVPRPDTNPDRHRVWAGAGVGADDLSCTVLTLGLYDSGEEKNALTESLSLARRDSSPRILTLYELERFPLTTAGVTVRSVENPPMIKRAINVGMGWGPPLVCTSGWPNTAVLKLLGGSCLLQYHGDFDWTGFRIACSLRELLGTRFSTWRYDADRYREGLDRRKHDQKLRMDRVPKAQAVPGDLTELYEAMLEHQAAVFVEDVFVVHLLPDIEYERDRAVHEENQADAHAADDSSHS